MKPHCQFAGMVNLNRKKERFPKGKMAQRSIRVSESAFIYLETFINIKIEHVQPKYVESLNFTNAIEFVEAKNLNLFFVFNNFSRRKHIQLGKLTKYDYLFNTKPTCSYYCIQLSSFCLRLVTTSDLILTYLFTDKYSDK